MSSPLTTKTSSPVSWTSTRGHWLPGAMSTTQTLTSWVLGRSLRRQPGPTTTGSTSSIRTDDMRGTTGCCVLGKLSVWGIRPRSLQWEVHVKEAGSMSAAKRFRDDAEPRSCEAARYARAPSLQADRRGRRHREPGLGEPAAPPHVLGAEPPAPRRRGAAGRPALPTPAATPLVERLGRDAAPLRAARPE